MGAAKRRGTGKTDPFQSRAVDRLNEALKESGLTLGELEAATGFDYAQLWRIFNGKQKETAFWVVARIAQALNVSLDYLTEGPRPPKSQSERPPAPATGTDPRR
ncbi:MAG TPA: helix-turn-helix transcriptional regulator [Polyangiaceae bacterium]